MKKIEYYFNKNKITFISFLTVISLIIIWELSALIIDEEYLLPTAYATMKKFFELWGTKSFYVSVGMTLLRSLIGFAISFILGSTLGILGGLNKCFDGIVKPLCSFIRTTPTMAIALIIMVWFKSNATPIIIGFMMVFPIIYTSVSTAITTADKNLIEMANVYSLTKKEKLKYIYLPHVTPILFSSMINAFGLNIKAVISAEILSFTKNSIGMEMYIAKQNIFDKAPDLFAWVIIAGIITIIFEILFSVVKNKIVKGNRYGN